MGGEKQKTAVVVGAGGGGIAAAARLAKAGFKVTVLEKNGFTGGRCSLIHHEGYRFDQGPSLLLLPGLFRETFEDLSTSLEAESVSLLKCEPNYRLHFHDGETITLSTDTALMKREIEKWEGKDGFERYLGFLAESHRHYELSVTHVLRKNFTNYLSLLRPSFMRWVFDMHPFESIYSRAAKYFRTERLRRAFTFGSMYMGMSPFDAPGTYSLLQYTELAEGVWYPRGGFHTVLDALVRVSERLGVEYRLSTPVESIAITDDRAHGVVLSSGELVSADVVVVNADLVYAYNNLLPATAYGRGLKTREASCSSISFYWALDTVVPQLSTHNVFLAEHYRESFDSIFKAHLLPTEPSFYVNVPSRIDASAAPEGKDAVVVLVPCGHLLDPPAETTPASRKGIEARPQDWPALVERVRSTVLSTLSARLGVELAAHIVHEEVNTPTTWRERFNLDRGAILGLSHSFFNVLAFRPRTAHARYKGLYFVGASTHPGTGVPVVLAGAKVVTEQILADEGIAVPSGRTREGGRAATAGGNELDRVQTRPLLSWLHVGMMLAAAMLAILVATTTTRNKGETDDGRGNGRWRLGGMSS